MIDYFSKYPYAELRSDDGSCKFKFCTYNYEFPHIISGYDADWQRNFILLTLPGFHAQVNAVVFEGSILQDFKGELEAFSKFSLERVELRPTEPYLVLNFSFNARKKVIVDGHIQYPAGCGATLEFEFETDLTYIDIFIKGIEEILLLFPPRNS